MRAALVALLLAVLTAPAAAKTAREYGYAYDPTWSALVRFLRVDENLKLLEKDADTGYILFELVDGKRTFSGAAELMKLERGTRVTIRLNERPSYMEAALLERFGNKLHDELGEPPPPPAPPPPPPPPPADTEEKKP
jgi:hypothetical protein